MIAEHAIGSRGSVRGNILPIGRQETGPMFLESTTIGALRPRRTKLALPFEAAAWRCPLPLR